MRKVAMARKNIATLMLIAMFSHAAAAQNVPAVCQDPTPADIFGDDKAKNYNNSGAIITFRDPDCKFKEYCCPTTIECADGFHKYGDIKLKCVRSARPRSQ
eukprot:757678_1